MCRNLLENPAQGAANETAAHNRRQIARSGAATLFMTGLKSGPTCAYDTSSAQPPDGCLRNGDCVRAAGRKPETDPAIGTSIELLGVCAALAAKASRGRRREQRSMELNQPHLADLTASASSRRSSGSASRLRQKDVLYVIRRPAPLARSLFAMFVVMPVVAAALAYLFGFKHAVEIALVALAISPLPSLIPKRLVKAGGKAPYALALLATVALLSVVNRSASGRSAQPIFRQAVHSRRNEARCRDRCDLRTAAACRRNGFSQALAGAGGSHRRPVLLVGGIVLRLAALALFVTSWAVRSGR